MDGGFFSKGARGAGARARFWGGGGGGGGRSMQSKASCRRVQAGSLCTYIQAIAHSGMFLLILESLGTLKRQQCLPAAFSTQQQQLVALQDPFSCASEGSRSLHDNAAS